MANKYLPILRVTKGSTDGTVKKGDAVYYSDDGSLVLINNKYGGWIEKDDLTPDVTDFDYYIDNKYVIMASQWGEVVVDRLKKEHKENGEEG